MKKVLLIFGASGALGKGVTKTLLKKNYDEFLLFDFKFDTKETDAKIKQIYVKDLSVEDNVQEAFANVNANNLTNYYLFSTIGGYSGGSSTWETELTEFDKMINMNLKSNFLIVKRFSEIIKESNGGSVCLTSAYTSIQPEAFKFAYGASKSALNYLVRTLALEGEKINLSINAIAPLIIDTPSNREWMKNANFENWMKPEEIGGIIHSLFENYNFISGNIIELKNRFRA
jgi:NAD(P)-dependent dehydrogenase (short-subunit alcohol dehydrogenase family)